ncbi:ubiquitin-specific protease [Trifolium repens]|nr:ubiquitin-specific protease [Trifolium repens]
MVPKPTPVLAATLKRVLVSKSREKTREKARAVIRAFEDQPSLHKEYSQVSEYVKSLVRVGKPDEKEFMRDLLKRGGLVEVEKKNKKKVEILYNPIDESSGFFRCPVEKYVRSLMNVPFTLGKSELEGGLVEVEKKNKKKVEILYNVIDERGMDRTWMSANRMSKEYQDGVKDAIQIYRAGCENKISKSKKDKIKWHKIQCPRQRNAIDCGYFIMRFMKEVIMEYPNTIPDDYFHRHRHPTYSKEKLDEVKEEWATCMVEDVINDAKRLK